MTRSGRDDNSYRSFTSEDVERVQLIQLLLSIGFLYRVDH